MQNIIYISNVENYKLELETKEIEHKGTTLRVEENKGLFVTLDNLSSLESVEVLGTYAEVFADEVKHNKYLSVNDYLTPLYYTDEDNNEVEYFKSKYIGKFAEKVKDLEEARADKIAEVKAYFIEAGLKPRVLTDLGFYVDGGRTNLQDFQTGYKHGFTTVKDADDTKHQVTIEQMAGIIEDIEANGLLMFQWKWTIEKEIEDCTTTEQLELIKVNYDS